MISNSSAGPCFDFFNPSDSTTYVTSGSTRSCSQPGQPGQPAGAGARTGIAEAGLPHIIRDIKENLARTFFKELSAQQKQMDSVTRLVEEFNAMDFPSKLAKHDDQMKPNQKSEKKRSFF